MELYNNYLNDYKQNKLIQNYQELFDSPEEIFDLNYFSIEDLMYVALELSIETYAREDYELNSTTNLGITELYGEGGVCRHDAQFIVDFLNMFDDSYAYHITGAYITDDNPKPHKLNHSIVAWRYSLNGIRYYDVFIDATQNYRSIWVFK